MVIILLYDNIHYFIDNIILFIDMIYNYYIDIYII
jgi:hypothetical protein